MHTKAPNPIIHLDTDQVLPIVAMYFECAHLKQLYRQGWLQRGVPPERCESVAEHTFGVALLSLFLAPASVPELDLGKVLRLALLHDLGEIYAGDLTPADAISRDEKYRREQQSVMQVLAKLPRGAEVMALWEEYAQGTSPEAQFVRHVDRLEMVLQASVYEHQGVADLSEFFTSVQEALSTPPWYAIFSNLLANRRDHP